MCVFECLARIRDPQVIKPDSMLAHMLELDSRSSDVFRLPAQRLWSVHRQNLVDLKLPELRQTYLISLCWG